MAELTDQLSREEHLRILRELIIPDERLNLAGSHERPKAIILGGQPGAGKGGLESIAKKELLNDVISIDPDALRVYHPAVDRFRSENPLDWSSRTHADAAAWADEALDAVSSAKKNLIFDTTLSNGEWAADSLIRDLQTRGYEVEVRVVAAHKLESEIGVDKRFTDGIDSQGFGRHVPKAARDAIYEKTPRSLEYIQANTDVVIRISNREGMQLYDSRTDPRAAGQALEEERTNRLREPKVTQSLSSTSRAQADWHQQLSHPPFLIWSRRLGKCWPSSRMRRV